MDYPAILCCCSVAAPFIAIARDVYTNRRPAFTLCLIVAACSFAVFVSLLYFWTQATDATCFYYNDVLDRLWRCSEVDFSKESKCCQGVEEEVRAGCGWGSGRTEFCTWFGEYTEEYCRVNYCWAVEGNVTVALSPNERQGTILDS